MALGVAGDADLSEARAPIAHRGQQLGGAREPSRALRVAGGHEDLAHLGGEQPVKQFLEVRLVAHQARRQVRDDRDAAPGQPLGDPQRGIQPELGRGGHGDLDRL